MKKDFSMKIFIFVTVATLVTALSCKNDEDDIRHRAEKITEFNFGLNEFRIKLEGGRDTDSQPDYVGNNLEMTTVTTDVSKILYRISLNRLESTTR